MQKNNGFERELDENKLDVLTEFFKVLGNPTRMRLLLYLMEQEACVSDLSVQLGLTQSAVSHQLNLLRASKLVKQRRDGKMIYYALCDNHVRSVIEKGREHVME